jgi:exodeoxyribonuclease VII large subunit
MSDGLLPAGTVLGVSDFVALTNQTLEYAYSNVTIRGELANFRISKNKWVYFDLKDESASVRFFGTVFQLSSPLEDGMLLVVQGTPRLHPLYGFSITISNIRPEGEGTIRRAAELLKAKLEVEGLFDEARKRPLPYPPNRVGLVTSTESAAYSDFIKVLNGRWRGVTVEVVDVQVQGEAAPEQVAEAIEYFSRQSVPPDVVVVTRGGGSAEDLYAFSTELVTRAVAASRVPTLVAIGHEIDVSLAELAADKRASTPSNAAELLVPHYTDTLRELDEATFRLEEPLRALLQGQQQVVERGDTALGHMLAAVVARVRHELVADQELLDALNPRAVLRRGYAIVHAGQVLVRSRRQVKNGDIVKIDVADGTFTAAIEER